MLVGWIKFQNIKDLRFNIVEKVFYKLEEVWDPKTIASQIAEQYIDDIQSTKDIKLEKESMFKSESHEDMNNKDSCERAEKGANGASIVKDYFDSCKNISPAIAEEARQCI